MHDFTASWSSAKTAVELRGTLDDGDAVISLTRTDANGTNPVRLSLSSVSWPTGPIVIDDYEALLNGSATYELTYTNGTARATQRAYVKTSSQAGATIHAVTYPDRRVTLDNLATLQTSRAFTHTVTDTIGAAAPYVTQGKLLTREITLTTVQESARAALAIDAALTGHTTYCLRIADHDELLYLVPTSISRDTLTAHNAQTLWNVTVTAREIARPSTLIRTIEGHTYGDDLAVHATYADCLARHGATYADRLEGIAQ